MIFLRPWLLLLILIPFLFKLFKEQLGAESPWRKVIDEKLLPYLLIKGSNATIKQRRFFKIILWILLSVAMAGPSWDKIDVPAHTYQPGTIIILELGPAMTGTNLERAQQKIYDILDALKGEQVGFVLYDRYGYTAGPLTFETDIIRNMIPYLDASVLPENKSDARAGFEQANKLFQNANIEEGRILFLTTGAFWDDDLAEVIQSSPHKIGILGIGPAEPHPIPKATGGFIMGKDGRPLMVYFDPKKMGKVDAFQVVTPDDTDVQNLIEDTVPKSIENERLTNQNLTIWRDRGGVLVVILLPFFALLFRKSIVILLLLCLIKPAEASLWLRPDQEEYRYQMTGVNLYRDGRYARAEKVFKSGKDVEALYNKGNALAFQQKIQEAIEAYKEALKKDPQHADARYNKEYLERQLQKNKQEKQDKNKDKDKQKQQEQNNKDQNKNQQDSELDQQKDKDKQDPQKQEQDKKEQNRNQQDSGLDQQKDKDKQDPKKQEQNKKEQNKNQQDSELDQQKDKDKQDSQKQGQDKQDKNQQDSELNQQKDKDKQDSQKQEQDKQDRNQQDSELNQQKDKNLQNPKKQEQNKKEQDKNQQASKLEEQHQPLPETQSDPESETEVEPSIPPLFDQESEKVLNQLPPDEDNVLRYRIRQQYKRYIRN